MSYFLMFYLAIRSGMYYNEKYQSVLFEKRQRGVMKETVYRTRISDIGLKVTACDVNFRLKNRLSRANGILSQIKLLHQHSTYEIFFVLDGSLHVIDEKGSRGYTNSAVIVPPYYNHYILPQIQEGYCFYFSMEQVPKGRKGLFSAVEEALSGAVHAFELAEASLFYLKRLGEAWEQEESDEEISHILPLLFLTFFEKMACPSGKKATARQIKYQNYIQTIDNCIAIEEGAKLSLEVLAKELNLCSKQVARVIRREYGCTLSELVNRRKLAVACMLLKHTDLSISEIALHSGYAYESYFFTLFKKAYGMSPHRYRECQRRMPAVSE